MTNGIMRVDVEQIGSPLRLLKLQRVVLTHATNVPTPGYFARPADGKWIDGVERSEEDSILVEAADVCIVTNQGWHEDFEDERIPV